MEELINNVKAWSIERELDNKEPRVQALKLMEEVGELASAILRNDSNEIIDALGDIQVVLIILHQQLDLNLKDTLKVAYNVIKDRKGKTVNGTFIKENDNV